MRTVFMETFCVFADFTTWGDGFDGGLEGEITLIAPDWPVMKTRRSFSSDRGSLRYDDDKDEDF